MKREISRRVLAALLAALSALSLTGCQESPAADHSAGQETNIRQEEQTVAAEEAGAADDTAQPAAEPAQEAIQTAEEEVEEELPAPEETEPEETAAPEETTAAPGAAETPEDQAPEVPEEGTLDEAQKNSIAMLNYLVMLSQEINDSKNSRLFLEEAYASLINNTNPEKVNELTESYLANLLDLLEQYRMIAVKRERLQYLYDQNKAMAWKEALPNPLALLSVASSLDIKRLALTAIYMAVDSYASYQSYQEGLDQQFLQDGWALDDEEAETLHESRKRAFLFRVDTVREDQLPGELSLSENDIEQFVTWKNNTNPYQKIQFFESEQATYQAFASYWLTLADCYFEHGDYEKCLAAMDQYEEIQPDIFRKDYYFAQELPKAIVAAGEMYDTEAYVPVAERYLSLLLEHTESTEWSLRYFAAQMYLDLYAQTGNQQYLETAYETVLNNVNNLVIEQRQENAAYLNEVQEVPVPEDATKEEQQQIKAYNESLREQRNVELPPVYEPLVLNCELLFALAERLELSAEEWAQLDGILHGEDEPLFLSVPLENRYIPEPEPVTVSGTFDKDSFTLPASCVSEQSMLRVTVTTDGKTVAYDDWTIAQVKRTGEDVEDFQVVYTSQGVKSQNWSDGDQVTIELFTEETEKAADVVLRFEVRERQGFWIFPGSLTFEQVA